MKQQIYKKMVENKKNQSVKCPSQGRDLNHEILWRDLKHAVDKWMPTNLDELKQCCKEEWDTILWQ